jgi:hypothetical protein
LTTSSPTGDVAVGATVHDTATVNGGAGQPTATGTVQFFLCQPATVTTNGGDCSAGGDQIGTPAAGEDLVSGSATSESTSNTNTVGKYCWRAEYSGDGFYLSSTHTNSTTECFTVKDTTSATSAQNWLPNDTATITSAGSTALSGTLHIKLYTGDNCGVTSGAAVANQDYSFTLASEASGTPHSTGNTTYLVSTSSSVSWLVTFTSTDPLVGNSSHCELTSLTITN